MILTDQPSFHDETPLSRSNQSNYLVIPQVNYVRLNFKHNIIQLF